MTEGVKTFLKNLLYVGAGTVISAFCTSVVSILGGRWLGPKEYGQFILIQSVAMFLYIPMELGYNTTMLKYISERTDYQRQSNIITGTLLLALLLTAVSFIVYFFIASTLSRLFAIPVNLFYLAVVFAALFVFYSLTTAALRGLNRMLAYAVFQIVFGSVVLLSFLAFILDRQFSFRTMTYPMMLAYGTVIILIFIFFIRKLAKWNFDIALYRMLSRYSLFSVLAGLSYIFYTNIDRIMIGRFLTVADVGIYAAYYTASINIAGLFWNMFNLIFFPTISGYKNKVSIFQKINKFIPYMLALGIPCLFICEYIVLKLYGGKYAPDTFLMLYFSIGSIIIVIDGLYGSLLLAIGLRGARITSFAAVVIAIVNFGLNFILIPKYGITGAIISLVISYSVSIVLKLWIGRDYLRKSTDQETYNV